MQKKSNCLFYIYIYTISEIFFLFSIAVPTNLTYGETNSQGFFLVKSTKYLAVLYNEISQLLYSYASLQKIMMEQNG